MTEEQPPSAPTPHEVDRQPLPPPVASTPKRTAASASETFAPWEPASATPPAPTQPAGPDDTTPAPATPPVEAPPPASVDAGAKGQVAEADTAPPRAGAPMTREDRVVFALRQAGLVVAVLCILWLMIVFVRPDLDSSGVGARGLFNVPMLLTVLVWPALLLFHAMAFERPRLSVVERVPLMAAIGITGILFILGALFSTASQSLRGLMWILLNSVAGGMFWWAVLGLAALVLERMRSTNGSRQADPTVP